jgi:hypothetical protein
MSDHPNVMHLRVFSNVTNEANKMDKQPSNKQYYIAMFKNAVLACGLLWFGITAFLTLIGA